MIHATCKANRLLLLVACAAATYPVAWAQQAATTAGDAKRVLQNVTAYYRELDSFEVEISGKITVKISSHPKTTEAVHIVRMARPNRLCMIAKTNVDDVGSCAFDGKNALWYEHRRYHSEQQTTGLLELDRKYNLRAIYRGLNPCMALPDLPLVFLPLLDGSLMDRLISADYVGADRLSGVRCHHLRLTYQGIEYDVQYHWELWIQATGAPLVHKATSDMAEYVAPLKRWAGSTIGGTPVSKNPTAHATFHFSKWKTSVKFGDDAFKFAPPDGTLSLIKRSPVAAREMPGNPAPDFTAPLLDGGEFHLADHTDKHIVILHFWAARQSGHGADPEKPLPVLIDIARRHERAGVELLAVNREDTPQTIRAYLKKKELALTVGLDPDGKIGWMYGLALIHNLETAAHRYGKPQTVVIRKGGIVESVHSGYTVGLRRKIEADLDSLIP